MTQSEFDKRRREVRKSAGLCIKCGQEDAYTMAGRSRCANCSEISRKTDQKRKEKNVKRWKDTLDRRRESGVCPRCGGETSDGYVTCERCRKKQRIYYHVHKVDKQRGENGTCYICNKNMAMQDKRLCQTCYEKYVKLCENNFRPNGVSIADTSYFRGLNNELFAKRKTDKV